MMANQDPQARSAEMQAAFHRQKAGEYFAEHRRQHSPSFLTRAKDEMAKAAEYEQQAARMRGQGRGDRAQGMTASSVGANRESRSQVAGKQNTGPNKAHGESERATQERARRWYEPGSVASDPLTQLSEANQGGGILAQAATYAARSTFDKEHRSMSGAKMLGKVASVPAKAVGTAGKAVGAAGKDILNAARQYQVQGSAKQGSPERGAMAHSKASPEKTGQNKKQPTQRKQPQQKSRQRASRQRGHER